MAPGKSGGVDNVQLQFRRLQGSVAPSLERSSEIGKRETHLARREGAPGGRVFAAAASSLESFHPFVPLPLLFKPLDNQRHNAHHSYLGSDLAKVREFLAGGRLGSYDRASDTARGEGEAGRSVSDERRTPGSNREEDRKSTRAAVYGSVLPSSSPPTVIELDTEYKLSEANARGIRRATAESRPRLFTGTARSGCAVAARYGRARCECVRARPSGSRVTRARARARVKRRAFRIAIRLTQIPESLPATIHRERASWKCMTRLVNHERRELGEIADLKFLSLSP